MTKERRGKERKQVLGDRPNLKSKGRKVVLDYTWIGGNTVTKKDLVWEDTMSSFLKTLNVVCLRDNSEFLPAGLTCPIHLAAKTKAPWKAYSMNNGSIIISKEHGVAKRKKRDKVNPAQYTENTSTKDEEKLFTDHLDFQKFIQIVIIYMITGP